MPPFVIIDSVLRDTEIRTQRYDLREWRNRQTRTFEGRVVIPYGFKSRLSHHGGFLWSPPNLSVIKAKM